MCSFLSHIGVLLSRWQYIATQRYQVSIPQKRPRIRKRHISQHDSIRPHHHLQALARHLRPDDLLDVVSAVERPRGPGLELLVALVSVPLLSSVGGHDDEVEVVGERRAGQIGIGEGNFEREIVVFVLGDGDVDGKGLLGFFADGADAVSTGSRGGGFNAGEGGGDVDSALWWVLAFFFFRGGDGDVRSQSAGSVHVPNHPAHTAP